MPSILPILKLNLRADFVGLNVEGDHLVVKSSSSTLNIENVRYKIIDVTSYDGNTAAYAYMASGEDEVDGSALSTLKLSSALQEVKIILRLEVAAQA